MQEIPSTLVEIKQSGLCPDQYVLVHDGQQIIELLAPGEGQVGTPASNTMLMGTREEIDAEVARLNLKPKRPRRPPELMPPSPNLEHANKESS